MAFRVDLTERAAPDLRRLYLTINAMDVAQANLWSNGLETAVLRLDEHPYRAIVVAEDETLRQLIFGRSRHRFRIIYSIDDPSHIVTVVHIRYGGRDSFIPGDNDDDERDEP